METEIDRLLSPQPLRSLRENIPPVQCMIWKGRDRYESITFDVYPFDTLETIKSMICNRFHEDPSFIPRFTFVGIPMKEGPPSQDGTYLPLDYLWYENGNNDPTKTHELLHPVRAMQDGDEWFVTSNGSYSSPNMELRGRSTLEDVFIKSERGAIPVLHVFSLAALLNEYKGRTPIAEVDWNKRFAGYFPHVPMGGPYEPDKEDLAFLRSIRIFLSKRASNVNHLNQMIKDGELNTYVELSGVRQMILTWKKPIQGFEGAASLFYRLRATEKRPCIRLLPMEGTAITKIHVRGVLPIPTLEDPRVLEGWGKETSPDPTMDVCVIKYLHRPSIEKTQPIYGTIHVLNDGTMNLILQPPKQIKKLNPKLDFANFRRIVEEVFEDLPHPFGDFDIHDISVTMTASISAHAKKLTTERLVARLPTFQALFTQIDPLPNETPILSLRYKGVSQYASESNVFQFITQYSMKKRLEGDELNGAEVIELLQQQFQFTLQESRESFKAWLSKRSTFTLQQPEEGEFAESFHPGIDLHIYEQHPSYHISIHRVNSYQNYLRIFTLLSVLFLDDDGYFTGSSMDKIMEEEEHAVEEYSRKSEERNEVVESKQEMQEKEETGADFYNDLYADLYEEESAEASAEASSASASVKDGIQPTSEPLVLPSSLSSSKAAATTKPSQRLVNPSSWFINKLQEIDEKLFKYTQVGKTGYTRQCAANEDRHPAVLNKEQYDRMRDIYRDDPIFWIEYPLTTKENPVEPMGMDETITVMRFGSTPDNINYYFCPLYYCLVDQIMIRAKDFESTRDRDGEQKPPNTCPFCQGRLIRNDTKERNPKPQLGYTVVKRKNAQQGDKYHSQIAFLKKSSHPEKLALPCCFISSKTLRVTDVEFEKLRSVLQEEEIERVGKDVLDYGEMIYPKDAGISYASHFLTIQKRTILESNKHLDPGSFGMAPPSFDAFFQQSSADQLVKRVTMQLKLRPYAQGFLRVGTENTVNESLLGVLAPLLFLNTIQQVKERIVQSVVPKIFLNAHFGNLVLEFYDPRDGDSMPSTTMELKQWSQQHLGIGLTSNNSYALLRLYNAYHRFIHFIKDSTQRKDLRHLQPLLAEPGLFRQSGLQLLIMEEDSTGKVFIKCPMFGVSMDRNRLNEVAFISRTMMDVPMTHNQYAHYELYLYTSNKAARGAQGEIHEPIIRWNHESRRYWPDIVKKRISEYMTQCQSRYRTIYTPQPIVNPMAMVPLSKAVEASSYHPEGIMKDSYNHIVGLTFHSKPGSQLMVILPVIDDGVISISSSFSIRNIYLDEEDIKLAPAEDAVAYYKKHLESLFSLYPGYRVKQVARKKSDNRIVALQLENGVYIPVAPPRDENAFNALQLPIVTITQFQWQIDKEILGKKWNPQEKDVSEMLEESDDQKCGTDSETLRIASYKQWEESYQQFRLMVANWLSSERAGPIVRKGVEDIIYNTNLPEYERRKRLYMYLSTILIAWFYPDSEWDRGVSSFLRKDCQLIDQEDACTGSCHWKQDEGKCLLHVTETTELSDATGKRSINTAELYTKRVIDELVRFPGRRKQLLKGDVSQVASILNPIHDGDQYIIPETSPTWTNLLRMEWAKSVPEEAKFYEEHSREQTEARAPPDGELSPELQQILGEDTNLRLLVPRNPNQEQPLLPFTSIFGMTLNQLGLQNNDSLLTRKALIKYVQETSLPIGMINLTGKSYENEPFIQFVRPATGIFTSVMVVVFLPDRIGLLTEEIGVPTVTISTFSESLQERWKKAGMVLLQKPLEESQSKVDTMDKLPLLVQQEHQKKQVEAQEPVQSRSKPKMAATSSQPPSVIRKPRRV